MKQIPLRYDAIRLLTLALIHRGGIVTRQFVFRTLLGLSQKASSFTIASDVIVRVLEDLGDETLLQLHAGSEGRQAPFGLTRAGRDELARDLREHQAITEIIRAIKDTVGPQAA